MTDKEIELDVLRTVLRRGQLVVGQFSGRTLEAAARLHERGMIRFDRRTHDGYLYLPPEGYDPVVR